MLLTLKRISQQIGVPESTLRRYRDLCESAVPSVDTGRGLMYPEEAVEVFRKIRFLREARLLEWSDVRKELSGESPPHTQRSMPPAPPPAEGGFFAEEAKYDGDEKLPRDARYIVFQMNTIATQLLSAAEESARAQRELSETVRRALKVISKQNRKHHDELNMNVLMLLDKVTELQSGVAYLQRRFRGGEK